MVGKPGQQELEAVDHMTTTFRKQTNGWLQAAVWLPFYI